MGLILSLIHISCDTEHNAISLGDVSDKSKVITVRLSGGGTLYVNRENIGDLSQAMGMFSPEDVNLSLIHILYDYRTA